uniref:Ig-like domain-containing protein n=1 Tax=Theropithecus gelada TaxID=9565 RepID=A0A8D2GHA8_THEGE
MGPGILCWALLCLLGADHTGAGVSQSPRYKVIKKGQDVALRCDPISGHEALYWYQQALGQGPEFLTYFNYQAQPDKSGLPNDRFSAERPDGSVSTLTIQRTEQQDSAVYLCASSLATAWHSHLLPVHKPHPSLSCSSQRLLTEASLCSSLFMGKRWIWTLAVLWVERDHRFISETQ